jgi:cyclic-di-GMP-binding protein
LRRARFPIQGTGSTPIAMPSFDITLEPDLVEVRNAVDQAGKEIGTRFDFKGTAAAVELGHKGDEKKITLTGDSDFQINQVMEVLLAKLSKRNVDVRFLDRSAKPAPIGGDRWQQVVTVKAGIESEVAKRIQKAVKESKVKVQAAIQGDMVRCTGAKRDDLQAAIAIVRKAVDDLPLSYGNFRN